MSRNKITYLLIYVKNGKQIKKRFSSSFARSQYVITERKRGVLFKSGTYTLLNVKNS